MINKSAQVFSKIPLEQNILMNLSLMESLTALFTLARWKMIKGLS
jgi:hypothetical protein